MTPRPRADRTARRAELASVAARLFAEQGVTNTSVSDIVKAAGVAQGTFYLYFDSKDDIVLAVVEQVAQSMLAAITAAIEPTGSTAVEKFLGLRDVLTDFDTDPSVTKLAAFMHSPENQALHDRLAESLVPGLIPLVESIVKQGIAEGSFDVPDVHAAAWFVLGGFMSIELSGTELDAFPAALEAATVLALRALGYAGGEAT
jgi:AcrR family transcriptional regulator